MPSQSHSLLRICLIFTPMKNCAIPKEVVVDFIVENGKDILGKVTFVKLPEVEDSLPRAIRICSPRSMMTDLRAAVTRGEKKTLMIAE